MTELVLNMSGFVPNTTAFVLTMTGVLLKNKVPNLNITGFVLNITAFVQNMADFVLDIDVIAPEFGTN